MYKYYYKDSKIASYFCIIYNAIAIVHNLKLRYFFIIFPKKSLFFKLMKISIFLNNLYFKLFYIKF